MPWKCFIVTPTNRAYRSLRRFTWPRDGVCPITGRSHDTSVIIDQMDFPGEMWGDETFQYRREDARWPRTCDCGYVFKDSDQWGCRRDRIFEGRRDGELLQGALSGSAPQIPPGAVLVLDLDDEDASHRTHAKAGPDGKIVMIRIPGLHDWYPDGPSRKNGVEGPGWTRTGETPVLTITPSIDCDNYHSHLTDGILKDDIAGRRYDEQGRLLK